MENTKRRRERDAKQRELYEKIFPELRKQREDKERDHRLGSRGAVRSVCTGRGRKKKSIWESVLSSSI